MIEQQQDEAPRVSFVPMCRECGKLSPLGWGHNYAEEDDARKRAENHEEELGHSVDVLEVEHAS